MLIGLDASRATKSFKRGSEQYSYYLIKALAEIDKKNQYLLYSPRPPEDDLKNLPKNFKWRIIPFPRLWTQLRLSFEMLKNPPDVLFVPSHVMPIIHPQKTVVTVHDIGYKHFPQSYSFFARLYEGFNLKFLLRSASKVIAPSNATKDDLIKFTALNPEKISVICHGFDQKLYRPTKTKDSPFPYLVFLGKLEHKKNIVGLLEAFEILRRDKNLKHKLVLIGQRGYLYGRIKQVVEKLSPDIRKDVLELGYLPAEKVAKWMREANVFVFPTFFEGFGFPVLEAQGAGVPVVASNIQALKEIGGGGAIFVNPQNPQDIADGVKKVILDPKLKNGLIKKGLKNITRFSWEKCARETLVVLEGVAYRQARGKEQDAK